MKNWKKSDSQQHKSTHQKGVEGEDTACAFLESQGYLILKRNYRVSFGEIDIIALDGETLVFVEVKSLPHGSIETLSHELNKIKQQKILKTAKCYLQNYRQYSNRYCRFDVLALDVPGLDRVHHIKSAFLE